MRELDEKDRKLLNSIPKHFYSPHEEREFRRMRHEEEREKSHGSSDPTYTSQHKNKS